MRLPLSLRKLLKNVRLCAFVGGSATQAATRYQYKFNMLKYNLYITTYPPSFPQDPLPYRNSCRPHAQDSAAGVTI